MTLVLGASLLVALPASADQADGAWPSWHGHGDNARAGVADGPSDPGIAWLVDDREETGDLQGPDAEDGFNLYAPFHPVLAPDGTLVVRGQNRAVGGVGMGSGQLIGIDPADGSLAWNLPYVDTNCVSAVDSQGRMWVHRDDGAPEFEDRTLQAIDPTTGTPVAGSELEDVPACSETGLHIGGASDHVAWMEGGGASRADTLAVYDVSGPAASEAWVLELAETDLVGNDDEPAIAFTDDSLIVPRRGTSGGERVVRLVEYPFGAPTASDSVVLPVIGDEPVDGDDQDAVQVVTVDDDTLVVGVSRITGGDDADAYLARVDRQGGMSVTWTTSLEVTLLGQIALGDGVVVTESSPSTMSAFSLDSGAEAWTVPSRESQLVTDASGNVYTSTQWDLDQGGGAAVSSYSPTGILRWEAPVSGINRVLALEDNAETVSNNVEYGPIAADGTLYLFDDGKILAVDDSGGLVADPPPLDRDRVAGTNRVETSVELSQLFDSAGTVVLARSDEYPDALAGAPLATALEAPILLSSPTSLPSVVAAEIERLGATSAVLLGGDGALSPDIETALAGIGVDEITRYAGTNRFDTAARIAADLPDPSGNAFVVEGQNADPHRGWPDAVAVSALAAHTGSPILLATAGALPTATAEALGHPTIQDATLIGGTAALSDEVRANVAAAVPGEVDRVFGINRYETSAAIANLSLLADMDPSTAWLSTGRNWPDSLSAAPVVASTASTVVANGGILLLVDGDDLDRSADTRDWLTDNAAAVDEVVVVGGAGVVSDAVGAAARGLVE